VTTWSYALAHVLYALAHVRYGLAHAHLDALAHAHGAPDQCSEDHIHATRISSGSAYCATPTEPSTWGKVKAVYR